MPLILPGNVASALGGGFEVANSCRFNRADDSYMSRTFGTPTNRKKFTISFWLKRGNVTVSNGVALFGSNGGDTSTFGTVHFNPHDDLVIGAANGSSDVLNLITDRKFRDVGAWYHICYIVDSTQATNTNRVKLYVNGIQETSFSTSTYPSEDEEFLFNMGTKVHTIGKYPYGVDVLSIDGYISEFVFIDGTTTSITDFGEFDEDSPTIWKPKDVSGLTFGNNGFYLDFEDSGDLGDDESGNTNDWTETNVAATDQATDTPTNNFCTLNGVFGVSNQTLAEGNLKVTNSTTTWNFRPATIGVTAGKWYAEYKISTTNYHLHGVCDLQYAVAQGVNSYTNVGFGTGGVGYYIDGEKYIAGTNSSYGNSYGDGEILGIALDMDNRKVYFAIDNTWQNSGDPTSGATGTGAISLPTTGTYTFAESVRSGGSVEVNFGNPPYANSSDAADANGYGAFEYAPPSGFLSLCTKNLGSDGG